MIPKMILCTVRRLSVVDLESTLPFGALYLCPCLPFSIHVDDFVEQGINPRRVMNRQKSLTLSNLNG